MRNRKYLDSVTSIKIDKTIHDRVRKYCQLNGLKIKDFVDRMLVYGLDICNEQDIYEQIGRSWGKLPNKKG